MGKFAGPETEMQLVPVDIGFCETQTCRGEKAEFALWRPDTSIGNRTHLCKKCAHELVRNMPDELIEEVFGESAEDIEEENEQLENAIEQIKVAAADGVIGKNQLIEILTENGLELEEEHLSNEDVIHIVEDETGSDYSAVVLDEETVNEPTYKPLEEMTNRELRVVAKELQVKGYSQMATDKLVEAIQNARKE